MRIITKIKRMVFDLDWGYDRVAESKNETISMAKEREKSHYF